jgi:CheY-like chemotaxis protein
MLRVRVVHWRAAEAEPILVLCRRAGFSVEYEEADLPATARATRKSMPDALLIDLSRMPAWGRELAFAIRRTKYTSHIPIVFAGGDPEKVAALKAWLPDAAYSSVSGVAAAVKKACAKRVAAPVSPPTVMERYGSRTLAQKLGISAGSRVALFDAPRNYAAILGALPENAELEEEPEDVHPVTLWFVRDPRNSQEELRNKRKLAGHTKLWIIWPKGSTNGLTGNLVREAGIEVGLVDYKICAVDSLWSGMAFAVRKAAAAK